MHLHHRLLSIGHSHRRAVLIMYFWAALLSFGAVALSITGGTVEVLVVIGALLVVGVMVVLSPRARRAAITARQSELAVLKERSRAAHPASRFPRRGPGGPTTTGGSPVTGPVASGRTAGVRR
jgi:UDP-GlcNAc:undecaprenyl-phosphate GlcNAc-1-phosphate transferase